MTIDVLLTRARPETCLSDLAIDRVVTGEPVAVAVTAHLLSCVECRARRSELERDHAQFPAIAPPLATRRRPPIRGWYPAVAAAVIAAAAVFAFVLRPRPTANVEGEGEGEGERTKGGFAVAIVVRHSDGKIETLLPNDALVPGDAIRFKISTDRGGYLGIIGLDAKPSVTAYVPSNDGLLPAIEKGRDRWIEGSIVLDDTLGPERIVAVVCASRAAVGDIVDDGQRALDRANGDPREVGELDSHGVHDYDPTPSRGVFTDTSCRQTSFMITKVAHR